jgi:hypothetical protein
VTAVLFWVVTSVQVVDSGLPSRRQDLKIRGHGWQQMESDFSRRLRHILSVRWRFAK